MLINYDAVGVSTLLNTLALDINRSRTFIDQQALPYQIPQVDASFKLALTSLTGALSDQPELRVATIRPGQAKVPISTLDTKLIACPPKTTRSLLLSVNSVASGAGQMTIVMNVQQGDWLPEQMAPIEVNLDRPLAEELNYISLSIATSVQTPVVIPTVDGQIEVVLNIDPNDLGALKLPLNFSAIGQHQTLIFSSAI
jgi:hypothetical protein